MTVATKKKMEVEIFDVSEVDCFGEGSSAEEFLERADRLELPKQKAFVHRGDIFPFRVMTNEERWVYGRFLPEKTDLPEFGNEAIPTRVLDAIERAGVKCTTFKVWHCPTKLDPLVTGQEGTAWNAPMFMIGRWAEALVSYEKLRIKMAQEFKDECLAALAAMEVTVKAELAYAKAATCELLLKKQASVPSYYPQLSR